MSRPNVFVLFALVCLVLIFLMLYNYESTDDLAKDAERLGNVAQPLDSVTAWWAAAAPCLGNDAALPARLRVYTGGTLPGSWRKLWDRRDEKGGYAARSTLVWVEVFERAIVTHEVLHLVGGDGHPADIFGADGKSPRCGLAPA